MLDLVDHLQRRSSLPALDLTAIRHIADRLHQTVAEIFSGLHVLAECAEKLVSATRLRSGHSMLPIWTSLLRREPTTLISRQANEVSKYANCSIEDAQSELYSYPDEVVLTQLQMRPVRRANALDYLSLVHARSPVMKQTDILELGEMFLQNVRQPFELLRLTKVR